MWCSHKICGKMFFSAACIRPALLFSCSTSDATPWKFLSPVCWSETEQCSAVWWWSWLMFPTTFDTGTQPTGQELESSPVHSPMATKAGHQGWDWCLWDGAACNKEQGKTTMAGVLITTQALLQQQPCGSTAGDSLSDSCLDQFWVWIWASLLVLCWFYSPLSDSITAQYWLKSIWDSFFPPLELESDWYMALTRFLHRLFISKVKMWASENKTVM